MKKLMDQIGRLFHLERRERASAATLVLVVLLVAAFLLVNLLAAMIPSHIGQLDISVAGMFTLSAQTKELCRELDRDVYLWLLCTEDDGLIMQTFVERYAALSPRIHAAVINIERDPTFPTTYGITDASNYGIIVECGTRSRYLPYSELYYTDPNTYDEYFLGEALLTNAIALCTAETLPTIYALRGHNELALPDSFTPALTDSGIEYATLALTAEDGTVRDVPANCATLVIFGPESDLSADELDKIRAYLTTGGKLVVTTDPVVIASQTNLTTLMGEYGMNTLTDNTYMVYEGDANYLVMEQAPYLMIAPVFSHAATAGFSQSFILNYAPHPIYINEDENRVTPLILSSESAVLVTYDEETDQQMISDPGMICSGAISEDVPTGSCVIWLGSTMNYGEAFYQSFGSTNYSFFMTLLGWTSGADASFVTVLPVRTANYLEVSPVSFYVVAALLVVIVPGGLIAAGIVIARKRKKK